MTSIYLIRHGEVYNPQDVYYGRLPGFRLSPKGMDQARRVGNYFLDQKPAGIFTSPMLRARQTAGEIAAALGGAPVRATPRLAEIRTPYDGKPASWLETRNWDLYSGNQAPFEQPPDILARVLRFIRSILQEHAGERVLAVTHGDIVLFLSLWAEGYGVDYTHKRKVETGELPILFPSPGSITGLHWNGQGDRPRREYILLEDDKA